MASGHWGSERGSIQTALHMSTSTLPDGPALRSTLFFALLILGAPGCYASRDDDAGARDAGSERDAGPARDAGLPDDSATPDAPVVSAPDAPIDPPPPCPVLPERPSAADGVGLLGWFQGAIVGQWRGERASPWDASPPAVSIEFFADGTYEARCEPAREDCAPLYWGDAVLSGPSARYRINDTTASGMGTGRLSPLWDGVPSWEADLEDLVIDETGGHLEMRALDPEGRGPLVFSLDRTCE
jgi:hypothetical protein